MLHFETQDLWTDQPVHVTGHCADSLTMAMRQTCMRIGEHHGAMMSLPTPARLFD